MFSELRCNEVCYNNSRQSVLAHVLKVYCKYTKPSCALQKLSSWADIHRDAFAKVYRVASEALIETHQLYAEAVRLRFPDAFRQQVLAPHPLLRTSKALYLSQINKWIRLEKDIPVVDYQGYRKPMYDQNQLSVMSQDLRHFSNLTPNGPTFQLVDHKAKSFRAEPWANATYNGYFFTYGEGHLHRFNLHESVPEQTLAIEAPPEDIADFDLPPDRTWALIFCSHSGYLYMQGSRHIWRFDPYKLEDVIYHETEREINSVKLVSNGIIIVVGPSRLTYWPQDTSKPAWTKSLDFEVNHVDLTDDEQLMVLSTKHLGKVTLDLQTGMKTNTHTLRQTDSIAKKMLHVSRVCSINDQVIAYLAPERILVLDLKGKKAQELFPPINTSFFAMRRVEKNRLAVVWTYQAGNSGFAIWDISGDAPKAISKQQLGTTPSRVIQPKCACVHFRHQYVAIAHWDKRYEITRLFNLMTSEEDILKSRRPVDPPNGSPRKRPRALIHRSIYES